MSDLGDAGLRNPVRSGYLRLGPAQLLRVIAGKVAMKLGAGDSAANRIGEIPV